MKSSRAALERLRAADPVAEPPEVEPFAELRARLGTSPLDDHDVVRPVRRHRARPALVVAVAAVAAGAVLAVTLPGRSGTPDVLAAVYRATGPDAGIVHFEADITSAVDGRVVYRAEQQSWYLPADEQGRLVQRDATGIRESVTGGAEISVWTSAGNTVTSLTDPRRRSVFPTEIEQLRSLYVRHQLVLGARGRATAAARSTWTLTTKAGETSGAPSLRATVDAQTFRPITLVQTRRVERPHGLDPEIVTTTVRYRRFEVYPDDSVHRAALRMAPHPGARP